ncbi:MAG: hypothetical protein R3352_08010, partial [Salinisphaeraceae bacterium]|nr:hypothetical protein [Salinisphaeraceae bacterium]
MSQTLARLSAFGFGLFSYIAASAALGYCAFFLANAYVPLTIDGGTAGAWPVALGINIALILLFGLQHSVMARA